MKIHNVIQGSPEWHQLRVGKITSTRMKKLMSKDNLDLVDEIIAETELGYGDVDDYISPEMQWGIDHEQIALDTYAKQRGVELQRPGMLQSDRFPMLTVSPDALVGGNGAVEVKCPKTKTHIKYIRMGLIPVDYRPQVLQYFLVHEELEWLDFISFDPRLERMPMWVKRVTREELAEQIVEAMLSVEKFIDKLEKYREEIWF